MTGQPAKAQGAIGFGLQGATICLTGGASGLGRACALALAHEGARVGIIDRRPEKIAPFLAELDGLGCLAAGAAADVRDPAMIAGAIGHIEDRLGPVGGLVASAGTARIAPAAEMTAAAFDLVMDVNVKGAFLCCQEAARRMVARGQGGAIVLMGSIDGESGHAGRAGYVASKHAVTGLTRTLALEWGRFGIRVNCVAPSLVDTPLVRAHTAADYINDVVLDRTPLARLATPEDVAPVVLMFLSRISAFVTGTCLPVDGGLMTGFLTRAGGADPGTG